MFPNWLIFDKQYRILKCLDFDKPIEYVDLYKKSQIRNFKEFVELVDYLGKSGYISADPESLKITLYCISSRREYIISRWQFRFVFIGAIAALIAAAPIVFSLFKFLFASLLK